MFNLKENGLPNRILALIEFRALINLRQPPMKKKVSVLFQIKHVPGMTRQLSEARLSKICTKSRPLSEKNLKTRVQTLREIDF
jgi:hypothetical protein